MVSIRESANVKPLRLQPSIIFVVDQAISESCSVHPVVCEKVYHPMSFDGCTTRMGPHNEVQVARWEAQKEAERKAWDRIKPRSWDPYEAKLECARAFNRVVEPLFRRDGKTNEPSPSVGYVAFAAC